MADTTSTVRSRELGEGLRAAMDRANLTGKRAAELIGWSETKMSRILSGQITVTELDVAAFLGLCTVRGPERERLLRLAREQDNRGWLQQHGANLPKQLKTLIDHEIKAVEITDFQALVISGLLQTADYARAMLQRSATVPMDEIEDRVRARMTRQDVFNREHRPQFTFYAHEFALRLPIGGAEVMSGQLHHLLRMSVRPYINVRIIPADMGAYGGLAGSCTLMEFAEFKPVVYVEEETAGHFLEEPVEMDAYKRVFGSLANCALGEGESREMIARVAVDSYGARKDDHGYP